MPQGGYISITKEQNGKLYLNRESCFVLSIRRGVEQGGKSPFSLLSEPISPSLLLFEPISPSSLNASFSFSPSSLLFPPISPSSQLYLGHFSLLPILFLPPLLGSYIDQMEINLFAILDSFAVVGPFVANKVFFFSFQISVYLNHFFVFTINKR